MRDTQEVLNAAQVLIKAGVHITIESGVNWTSITCHAGDILWHTQTGEVAGNADISKT